MAKPRPEKKREPAEPTVLPMELQVGDRITDENQRDRQLGDTELGRFQAHQREADDRRGGQITWTV